MSSIYVTQPQLPPLEEFTPYLERIWQNKILTNNGELHRELEAELCRYLDVPFISLFNNGTNALLTALQALDLDGEIITTPFTFVATTNSIIWCKLKPVFIDVDPVTFNMDPALIEAAITPNTSAIMPVHCYGQPCDIDAIEAIAKRHNLKVIYDAAHAFGVKCHCGSVLNHGDLSVLSFHATKVFNTIEGGAIVSHSAEMKSRIDRLKNFGIINEIEVSEPGLNGKMNEVQAAFGLMLLPHLENARKARAAIDEHYRNRLSGLKGIRCLPTNDALLSNFSYFPIVVDENFAMDREALRDELKAANIFARRYFFPLTPHLLNLDYVEGSLPIAEKAAQQILCLPIYPDLALQDHNRIIEIIERSALNS